jgi:hypothetical protein
MKRIAFLPVLLSFFLLFAGTALVQGQPVMREKAKKVINRTAIVVYAAHKQTIANQVFTGNLKKAVIHQRIAIKLFHEGKFMKAIHHSRRARDLARLQIEANHGTFPAGFEPTSDESAEGPAPTNEQLDEEANSSEYNSTSGDDKQISTEPLDDMEIKE